MKVKKLKLTFRFKEVHKVYWSRISQVNCRYSNSINYSVDDFYFTLNNWLFGNKYAHFDNAYKFLKKR